MATAWAALQADGFTANAVSAACRQGTLRRVRRSAYIDGGVRDRKDCFQLASLAVPRTRPGDGLRQLGVITTPQVELTDDRGFVGRVDLLDEETGDGYEFDGLTKYAGADGKEALAAEKTREDRIRRLGHRVIRVTWSDLDARTLWALARPRLAAA